MANLTEFDTYKTQQNNFYNKKSTLLSEMTSMSSNYSKVLVIYNSTHTDIWFVDVDDAENSLEDATVKGPCIHLSALSTNVPFPFDTSTSIVSEIANFYESLKNHDYGYMSTFMEMFMNSLVKVEIYGHFRNTSTFKLANIFKNNTLKISDDNDFCAADQNECLALNAFIRYLITYESEFLWHKMQRPSQLATRMDEIIPM